MLSNLLRVESQVLHASSCVAETSCPQVNVVDTCQLLHLMIAHHLTIWPQEVKGYNGTLLKRIVEISPTVKHTRFVSIPMSDLRQGFVHRPECHMTVTWSHEHLHMHAHACTCMYLAKWNVCCWMHDIDLPSLHRVAKPCLRARMARNGSVPSSILINAHHNNMN